MSSEYLSSYIDNSGSRAEDTVPELVKKPSHELAIENCFHYRQHGASSFLYSGNSHTFFECMHRSAGCYLFVLQNEKESEKRTSESEPFFDALAAGLYQAASAMAAQARTTWNSDYEYEDDFLYFHFLMSYFFKQDSTDDKVLKSILEKYEAEMEGDFGSRLDICKSFYDNDPNMFNDSFDQFLREREQLINEHIEREVIGEEEWAWSKYISTEALALLQLAKKLNFKTETNYQQAPELLRQPTSTSFNPDFWRSSMGAQYREE